MANSAALLIRGPRRAALSRLKTTGKVRGTCTGCSSVSGSLRRQIGVRSTARAVWSIGCGGRSTTADAATSHGMAQEPGIRRYRLPNRLALAVARECIGMSPRWASRAAAPESCAVVAADCVMVRTSFACRAMA
jgi:hypothetical protein